ncbi:EAL domain-containing protein [Sutcliffiella rhizosphaerae]|uniref:EAL domain-containing protein n=1 Tax=Sutcliffiella rhizosphaerae TaxID=2880967 RepID=A0ABN8AGL6_9BACI|nr:EAL domain-containing protein [Sutcliffiella rhizosphaerae]CAG9623256.1 hypothetical protein BACCIP111883_04052 [Sutcliffiella rhizosphaerae]
METLNNWGKQQNSHESSYKTHLHQDELFHSIFHHHPHAVLFLNAQGDIVRRNKQATILFGYKAADISGEFLKFIPPNSHKDVLEIYGKSLHGLTQHFETKIIHKNKCIINVRITSVPIIEETKVIGTYLIIQESENGTEEKIEAESKTIYDSLDLGIWSYSLETKSYLYFSDGVERITGYSLIQLYSQDFEWSNLIVEEDLERFHHHLSIAFEGQEVVQEYCIQLPSNILRWVRMQVIPLKNDEDNVLSVHGVITDITDYKQLLEKVNHFAYHDYLTGLPNRRLLNKAMEELITKHVDSGTEFAVLYINLDRFKYTNDTLGHSVGDALLQAVAGRLGTYKMQGHFVSRASGDEFILLYHGKNLLTRIKDIAKELIETLREPFYVEDYELFLTACVGVSVFPIDGEHGNTLLKNANIALYRAKELGKNYFEIFTPSISVKTYQQFTLERDMHKAIKEEQFEVYFQPKVHRDTYEIVGAEALIRWNHPVWGMVSPGEFIPLAEESGIINEIGDYVMEKVLKQLGSWKRQGMPLVPISINVAPQRFLRKNYFNMVKQTIINYEVNPNLLELEITESSFLHNSEVVLKMVQELRKLGVKVALDDFGTGYSSMTRLTELEIDILKVDRSFVKDVESNRKKAVILESLIIIAKELKMEVVVEGVETEAQLKFMQEKKCDIIQGYIFSKPVPAWQFTEMLETRKLSPKTQTENGTEVDNRKYFRIELPYSIKGELTIKRMKDYEVNLGSTAIVIENIGPGGLRFCSRMQFPVQDELILSVSFQLLGITKTLECKVVWKSELEECYFQYGVEFILTKNERADVNKLLNHTAIELRDSHYLPNSNMIKETGEAFL